MVGRSGLSLIALAWLASRLFIHNNLFILQYVRGHGGTIPPCSSYAPSGGDDGSDLLLSADCSKHQNQSYHRRNRPHEANQIDDGHAEHVHNL